MNKIINTFLLVGDKFLSEMRLSEMRFPWITGKETIIEEEAIIEKKNLPIIKEEALKNHLTDFSAKR